MYRAAIVSFTVTCPNSDAATAPASGTTAQPSTKDSSARDGHRITLTGISTRRSVCRSISRPTENCVTAPHSVATNAADPISGSRLGSEARRSSISFGSSSVKALNTRPDTVAISSSTVTARRTRWRGMAGKGRAEALR